MRFGYLTKHCFSGIQKLELILFQTKKIKEPSWYEKMYNISTVENKGLRPKIVGDLQFEDGKKLI